MAQAAFQPTPALRAQVKALVSYGVKQDEIGKLIGCSKPTLLKYFKPELDFGALLANAKVAQTLFAMATSGQHPAATFFWLKTRAGWREVNAHEVTGKDGTPLHQLTDDELTRIAAGGGRTAAPTPGEGEP